MASKWKITWCCGAPLGCRR